MFNNQSWTSNYFSLDNKLCSLSCNPSEHVHIKFHRFDGVFYLAEKIFLALMKERREDGRKWNMACVIGVDCLPYSLHSIFMYSMLSSLNLQMTWVSEKYNYPITRKKREINQENTHTFNSRTYHLTQQKRRFNWDLWMTK